MRIAIIAYFLGVLSYLLSVNANLFAYLGYLLNYNFIVENLCVQKDEPINTCRGHCHLRKNFEKVEDNEFSKERKNVELKKIVRLEYHRLTSTICNLIPNLIFLVMFFFNTNFPKVPFIEKNDPPPKYLLI